MKENEKAPRYAPGLARAVLTRVASGESLTAICGEPDMPSEAAVLDWMTADRNGFAGRYGRARAAAAHRMADEMVAIADNRDGDLNRDKLRIECRKWILARLAPEVFGDRPRTKDKAKEDTGSRLVRWMTESEEKSGPEDRD